MKSELDIDWRAVLGPLLDNGIDSQELGCLQRAISHHPRRAIRLSARRSLAELPFAVEPVPWYSEGYFVERNDTRPGSFLHYAAGDYYIQDAGSMLALALSDIRPGQFVCDLCASPGGKSNDVLQRLAGSGLLVSNEVIAARQAILGLTLSRTGFANYVTIHQDVQLLSSPLNSSFDCVIVDAPCSGQSMLARGKQTLAAYSAAQVTHSAARQRRILGAATQLVKPGGRLVYSTCTFSYAENEAIVQALINEQTGWSVQRIPQLAAWETPGFDGCYRLWPHRDQCAGAFAAVLIRQPSNNELVPPALAAGDRQPRQSHRRWTHLPQLPESVDWYGDLPTDAAHWFQRGQQIHRLPIDFPPHWLDLVAGSVPIAELQTGRAQPVYGSSVALSAWPALRQIELSDEQATSYVAGNSFRGLDISPGHSAQGWCRLAWRGRMLAWGKLAGGRLQNHFPKALRQPAV